MAVAMLEDGATSRAVTEETGLSMSTVMRIRRLLFLPSPRRIPAGGGSTPEQQAAYVRRTHPEAVAMLQDGATNRQTAEKTGLSTSSVTRIRRLVDAPSPHYTAPGGRTIADVLALYTQPYNGGHARWTGPLSGREYSLFAAGRRYNARHEVFRAYYGRDPDGPVRTGCGTPGCISGPHLTDHTTRTTKPRSTT